MGFLRQTKILIGFLLFALTAFVSCGNNVLENNYIETLPDYEHEIKPNALSVSSAMEAPPPHRPFDGNIHLNAYRFLWGEERDRNWEEDIIYLAHNFRKVGVATSAAIPRVVSGHPLVSGIIAPVDRLRNLEVEPLGRPGAGFRGVFRIQGYDNFYNGELRTKFFEEINELITHIPKLNDQEIVFVISRILAYFGDAHTGIDFNSVTLGAEQLPILATRHFDEQFSGTHLYSWPHPRTTYVGIDSIINTRLLYINNVSIEEIFNRIRPITQYDHGIEASFRLLSPPLFHRSILNYIGVVQDENIVPVTVRDIDGNIFTVYAPFVTSLDEIELTAHQIDTEQFFMASRSDENYWFRYFPDENMMYVRIWRSWEMPHLPSMGIAQHLRNRIISEGGVDTFVLDLRSNMGGELLQGFDDFLLWSRNEENRSLLGEVYVVVDEWTNSNGVVIAVTWQTFMEGITIIGSPAGSLNFFSEPLMTTLPNSRIPVNIPRRFSNYDLGIEGHSPLIPDIIIYRTLEDYINHHDAAIAVIRERAAERRAQ